MAKQEGDGEGEEACWKILLETPPKNSLEVLPQISLAKSLVWGSLGYFVYPGQFNRTGQFPHCTVKAIQPVSGRGTA
jgi:hypothetical protein